MLRTLTFNFSKNYYSHHLSHRFYYSCNLTSISNLSGKGPGKSVRRWHHSEMGLCHKPELNEQINQMKNEIEQLTMRVAVLERSIELNKTLTEEVLEKIISPIGLKTLYMIAPDASHKIKEFDALLGEIKYPGAYRITEVGEDVQSKIAEVIPKCLPSVSEVQLKINEVIPKGVLSVSDMQSKINNMISVKVGWDLFSKSIKNN